MKYQVLFSLKNKKYSRLLSAAVAIDALRVNIFPCSLPNTVAGTINIFRGCVV